MVWGASGSSCATCPYAAQCCGSCGMNTINDVYYMVVLSYPYVTCAITLIVFNTYAYHIKSTSNHVARLTALRTFLLSVRFHLIDFSFLYVTQVPWTRSIYVPTSTMIKYILTFIIGLIIYDVIHTVYIVQSCSLFEFLNLFKTPEVLDESESWNCYICKKSARIETTDVYSRDFNIYLCIIQLSSTNPTNVAGANSVF